MLVLYGACDEVVHTPYGPFVQALDRLTRAIEPDELRSALGAGGGELTRLLPHLAERTGELSPPVEADPDTERHRLHTAVTELLTAVAEKRPVLLIIEDGHWADAPTLLLLRHLARPGGDARLLLLATFRDTEADMPETLSETLADLRRSEDVVRLRLGGLSGEDVMEFVRRAAGADSSEGLSDLSRAISDLTEGNAFLVNELWRALIETGAVEVVDGAITLTPADRGARNTRERSRGGQPAPLSPRARDDRPARAGGDRRRGVRARHRPQSRRSRGRPAPGGPRRGHRQRDDRGAAVAQARLSLQPRAGAQGAVRPSRKRAARRAPPARRRGARKRGRALRPGPRGPRAPFRGRGAPRGDRARSRVQPRRGARCALGARVRRGGGEVSHGARAPDRARVRAGRGLPRARHCEPPGGQGARRTRCVPLGRGDRPRARQRRSARTSRDRLRGDMLAPRNRRRGCGRAPRGGRGRAQRRELRVARRVAQRARPRARLPGRSRSWRAGADERDRDGAAARRSHRPRHRAHALLLVARNELAGRDPRDGDRGEGPGCGAGQHGDPGRGDGLARSCPRRARRGRCSPDISSTSCCGRPSRPRSRSSSMSRSTSARRSRSATAASKPPKPWRTAPTSGAVS